MFCKLIPKHKRGHRSVVSLFNDNFAYPGLFPMEIKTFIGRLEAMRNIGDYEPAPKKKLTPEDAREAIEMAEKVNSAVRQYIDENGGIENHE